MRDEGRGEQGGMEHPMNRDIADQCVFVSVFEFDHIVNLEW